MSRRLLAAFLLSLAAPGAALGAPVPGADAAGSSFTTRDLETLIETRGLTQLDDVLAALPRSLALNSTFIYRSESIQQATQSEPRVLLWSDEGRFVMSVNGAGLKSRKAEIEILEQAPDLRFRLLQLKFPLSKDSSGRVRATPEQPVECLSCHGDSGRPIWAEYPDWPGVYGSVDDALPVIEKADYIKFIDEAAQSSRYRNFLPDTAIRTERPLYPYRENAWENLENLSISFAYRPNLRLGLLLDRLNAARVADEIERTHAGQVVPLVRALLSCDGAQPLGSALADAGIEPKELDMRDFNESSAGLDVVQSYFDGAATANELLAARLSEWLAEKGQGPSSPNFAEDFERTLNAKYAYDTQVTELDRPFMTEMDRLGGWISLPYADNAATRVQKREPDRASFEYKRARLCSALQ